jgi:hypothetical protein
VFVAVAVGTIGVFVAVGTGVSVGVNVKVRVATPGVGVRGVNSRAGAKHLKPLARLLPNAHCRSGPLFGISVAEQKKPGPPKHCTVSWQGPIAALTDRHAVWPLRSGQNTPMAI